MIRFSNLSLRSRIELENRYDGPIPQDMIEWYYEQDQKAEAEAAASLNKDAA